MEEVLKRYYKGETTLAEERELRSAWQRGELPENRILGLRDPMEIPEGLNEKLQRYIRQKRATQNQTALDYGREYRSDGRADPFIQGDLHNDTPSGYTTVG